MRAPLCGGTWTLSFRSCSRARPPLQAAALWLGRVARHMAAEWPSTTPHAQRGPTGPPPPPPRCGDDAAAGTAPAKAPSHADRPRDGGDRRSEARFHAAHPRAALGTTALPACPRRARWRASRRWSGCTRMCEEHGVGATRAEQRAITTGSTAALGRWQMRDDAMLAARPRGRPRALTPSLPCWRCQIQQQG